MTWIGLSPLSLHTMKIAGERHRVKESGYYRQENT